MNNTQTLILALTVVLGTLAIAYLLSKEGKTVEMNALGMISVKISG